MIPSRILAEVCHWDQHSAPYPTCGQLSIGNQVIESTLADREKLSRLSSADKQLLLGWNCGSSWWLSLRGVEWLHHPLLYKNSFFLQTQPVAQAPLDQTLGHWTDLLCTRDSLFGLERALVRNIAPQGLHQLVAIIGEYLRIPLPA
jgi:hypothetical protein